MMEFGSQKPNFSTEPCTKGFDNSSGDKWIYPDNYPLRDYQFNIVKSALYHNTLVCLPTGLGKTFIAAVVMYNFWRWYPQGKIVFLAPTKPLVAQQINACYEIMGIASEETVELTGAIDQKKRQVAWSRSSRARVIFATPQVFHKDLEKDIIPTELIKCIVVDEAHRALGKHSYCESIRLMCEKSKYFRILGLSATPGSKLDAVQCVIRNLRISRLELRDDDSPDIMPYINERKLDIIVVGLGNDLERFKERYIEIMDPHVRVLVENNVLRGNTGNLSKGRIFLISKEWQQKPNKGQNHGYITKTLMILLTMYHAYELMIRHGLRAFYNFYQKHEDKFWLNSENTLKQLLEEINYFLGPFPDISSLPSESFPDIPHGIRFGHNKFHKLKDLLLQHFERYEYKQENTRAIVFVEFRDIVNEIYVLLLQSMPLLRPQKFVGQAGQKRREQKKALDDFRNNKVNVLISTSVGEEGLDVGEVDLIVCFDISNVSPIRLVQRMGRTGRKRDGHIIVLVTDGKEHQTLKSSMSRRDSLNCKVLHSSGIMSALYQESPRMVPEEFQPECRKMCVTVPEKEAEPSTSKGKTKKTRKRDDISKKQLKNPFPSASQTLMKFLKRTKDNTETDVDNDIVEITVKNNPTISQTSQTSQYNNNTVKSNNVKLLTCDDAAVEFLTLCAMKESQNDRPSVDKEKKKSYFPSYYEEPAAMDFNFEMPDVRILDCLKTLKPYEDKITNNDDDDDSFDFEKNQCLCSPQPFNEVYQNDHDNIDPVGDSRFEALLDDSSDNSDKTYFELPQTENNVSIVDEKVDWDGNVDANDFEGWMDEWSDETRVNDKKNSSNEENKNKISNDDAKRDSPMKFRIFGNTCNESSKNGGERNEKSPYDDNDKFEKTNDRVDDNSTMKFGVFENLLNESETSSEIDQFHTMNKAVIDNTGAFEDLLNEKCETSGDNYDSDETIDGLTRVNNFHGSSSKDSITKSEKYHRVDNDFSDKSCAFEDLLNSTSNDSETQANVEFHSEDFNGSNSGLNSTKVFRKSIDKIIVNSPIEENVNVTENLSNERFISDESIDEINQESIDVLAGYELKISQNSDTQKSQRRVVTTSAKISSTPTNSTPKTSGRMFSRVTLKTGELDAFERDSAEKPASSKNKFVNKKDQGDASPSSVVHLRSSSPSSRWDGDTTNDDLSSPKRNFIAEKTESDEDIFGIDDLLVDSEFEEQINEIEKSAEKNVSGNEDKKNFESFGNDAVKKIDERDVSFVSEKSREIVGRVEQSEKNFQDKKFIKDDHVSPNKSIRLEVNLNSCKINQADSKEKENNDLKSSTKSRRWEINCEDWNNDVFHVRGERNKSLSDEKNKSLTSNESIEVKNPEPVANSDRIIDDGDWDSDGFEIIAVASKPSTSNEKILNSSKSTDEEKNDIVNRSKLENTVGWLTTRNPKSRVSLSKKLSRNIHNDLWRKRDKENKLMKGDSDSENDFTVSRLETTFSNEIVSDYFVKPNPVAAMKKSKIIAVGLNDPAKPMRNPLSLRRNEAHHIDVKDLKKFSAPAKFNVRDNNGQVENNRRKIGIGREKSASCDLETRKRKKGKNRTNERKRMRIRSDFIDDEAEVSSEYDYSSGTSGSDDDLDGFVSYTQNVDDHVDMQAHYLQTIKSPRRPGGFYVRRPQSPNPNLEIYSQPVHDETNSYIFDSFCVDENDDVFEESASSDEITKLERFEMRRKSNKRKREDSSDPRVKRKRKIIVSADASSEDEMEKMRQQLREESFALKNKRE